MFVFTMVRNPWDRLVSFYHWLRAQTFQHPMVLLAKDLTFGAFLRHDEVQKSFRQSPAASYVRNIRGETQCTLFIRLEKFKDDAQPLFDHLGFRFDLPHLNASSRVGDFRQYYTPELRDIVAQACSDDIARFGYAFDGS